MPPKEKKFSSKKVTVILLVITAVLLAFTGAMFFLMKSNTESGEVGQDGSMTKQYIKSMLTDAAQSVKDEVELLVDDIVAEDFESARTRAGTLSQKLKAVRTPLKYAAAAAEALMPERKQQLEAAQNLLDAADMAMEKLLLPGIDLLEAHPLSSLKAEGGFNVAPVCHYLDFAESVMPEIETVMAAVNAFDLSALDSDGKLTKYVDLANTLMDFYREDPDVLGLIQSMLGVEGDRLYLVAVQNPAEIRASGGFPGSFGRVRIQNGVLSVGDFSSIVDFMSMTTPREIQITREEREMFHHLSGIWNPRDADLCPDYRRVGHIWACAYEDMHKEPVAGVISVTPHIVQRLLAAMGREIQLSDGSVLNGDNAMEVLLHDIYFKYFSKNYVADRSTISDALFAEAAKKTLGMLTEEVSVSRILNYLPVAQRSFADRTLMIWMKDEQEEAFMVRMGWDGGLNADPNRPEVGVYFSCVLASKMGWYSLINTQIGERTRNEDGSYSYPVTVTLANCASVEEIKNATTYISGGGSGSIYGVAYFFAPAGGTVSDFHADNGQKVQMRTYHGLELGFMEKFLLKPDVPVTVTYTVTTAPGVETPLGISQTPTAQDYYSIYGVG